MHKEQRQTGCWQDGSTTCVFLGVGERACAHLHSRNTINEMLLDVFLYFGVCGADVSVTAVVSVFYYFLSRWGGDFFFFLYSARRLFVPACY